MNKYTDKLILIITLTLLVLGALSQCEQKHTTPAKQYGETVYRYFTIVQSREPYNTVDAGEYGVTDLWLDTAEYPNYGCDYVLSNDNSHNCGIFDASEIAEFLYSENLSDEYTIIKR